MVVTMIYAMTFGADEARTFLVLYAMAISQTFFS